MSEVDQGRVRPKTTVGQWITAGAAVLILVVLIVIPFVTAFVIDVMARGAEDTLGEALPRVVKEGACIPYANGVLELAERGYTAEEIEHVYDVVGKLPDDETWGDPEEPPVASPQLPAFCGTPAEIIAAAGK